MTESETERPMRERLSICERVLFALALVALSPVIAVEWCCHKAAQCSERAGQKE